MGSDKKHRSLRDVFKSASSTSLSKQNPENNTHHMQDSGHHSHRFFLRSRGSRSSINSPSSSSSIKSSGGIASNPESFVEDTVTSADSDLESSWSSTGQQARGPPSTQNHEVNQAVHQGGGESDKTRGKKKKEKSQKSESHHSLRRFFKILGHHSNELKPTKTLPSITSKLAEKYDFGRLIGAGASGSVNIINAKHDPTKVYALKKFRSKLKTETEHDYIRKVKNEFLVGDYLKQQNLIHTIELFLEKPDKNSPLEYFIVMEYCPYDFFNLVMSGLMTKEEIYCYFKQICFGVNYLHLSGIAHRDLKLDNCVVDNNGILKLIDFGSAFQFRKSSAKLLGNGESKPSYLHAKGIVGSDPYLAPEVFAPVHEDGYDARLADVWSIAIIFCCMVLKRFPWKIPRPEDPSYKAFAGLNNHDEPVAEPELAESMSKDLSLNPTHSHSSIPKYGQERLLRILPTQSRKLIGRMLEIDTERRFTMEDVMGDRFIELIKHCHVIEKGEKIPDAVDFHEDIPFDEFGQRPATEPATPADSSTPTGPAAPAGLAVSEEPAESIESQPAIDQTSCVDPSIGHLEVGKFIKADNHTHHLITGEELERINDEKERVRRMKKAGMA